MSGIQCVWANIPDSALDWYENECITTMVSASKFIEHALHCEVTCSGMEGEAIGKLDSPWRWLAVYEASDLENASNHATWNPDRLKELAAEANLHGARFDVRTYMEEKRWQMKDWDGDAADVASVAAMEWNIPPGMEDEVLDFYINKVGPCISSSPDVLRFRLFKITSARKWVDNEYMDIDKSTLHTYFTLVELATDEWPWSVVVDLADDVKWSSYFESQTVVKWQLSHYLVQASYPEHDSAIGSDTREEQ